MTLLVLEAARDDLIAGFAFYEAREHGIGDHFLACLYSDVESLRIFGGIHRRVYKNLQRSLSKRFPFAIYYTVENNARNRPRYSGLQTQSLMDPIQTEERLTTLPLLHGSTSNAELRTEEAKGTYRRRCLSLFVLFRSTLEVRRSMFDVRVYFRYLLGFRV